MLSDRQSGPMNSGTVRVSETRLTSVTVLLGGLTACGTRGPGHWSEERAGETRTRMAKRISGKLGLNAEQKRGLDVLADEIGAQHKALRGDGADPRAGFKAVIAGDRFDRARAQALLDQKTVAVQTQAPRVLTALADFYDSLTPAQQQQVRERLDRRRRRWARG